MKQGRKKKGLLLTGHVIFVKVYNLLYNLLYPQELFILHSQKTPILEVEVSNCRVTDLLDMPLLRAFSTAVSGNNRGLQFVGLEKDRITN